MSSPTITNTSAQLNGIWLLQMAPAVTLNDAQIKALPSTPFTIISAPGSGKMIQPIFATLYAKTTAGAYTNINAAGVLNTQIASGPGLGSVPNDAAISAGSKTRLTDLLGGTNNRTVNLLGYFDTEGVDGWGPVGVVMASATGTNAPLQMSIDNGGSGNLTGGNAANTLRIVVCYYIATVP